MKKIWCILACLLEIASLAGAYVIHYFAKRKLGMVRYLNFKNMNWEKTYPIEMIQKVSVWILFVFAVFILYAALKRKERVSKTTVCMCLAMIVLMVLYFWYSAFFSTEVMAEYYFLSGLFFLAAAIQTISTAVAVLIWKK